MENKVMMRLEVRDETGDTFEAKQEITLSPNYGRGFKDEFARFINSFMDMMTFPNYKNEYVFLESITEEEYDYLLNALEEFRKNQEE